MLSPLQKYIIKQCAKAKDKTIAKDVLEKFYDQVKIKPKKKDLTNIISKSIDRLIKKELIVGLGIKTSQRWFCQKIKLTAQGKKMSKKLFGYQQTLPFKIYKKN